MAKSPATFKTGSFRVDTTYTSAGSTYRWGDGFTSASGKIFRANGTTTLTAYTVAANSAPVLASVSNLTLPAAAFTRLALAGGYAYIPSASTMMRVDTTSLAIQTAFSIDTITSCYDCVADVTRLYVLWDSGLTCYTIATGAKAWFAPLPLHAVLGLRIVAGSLIGIALIQGAPIYHIDPATGTFTSAVGPLFTDVNVYHNSSVYGTRIAIGTFVYDAATRAPVRITNDIVTAIAQGHSAVSAGWRSEVVGQAGQSLKMAINPRLAELGFTPSGYAGYNIRIDNYRRDDQDTSAGSFGVEDSVYQKSKDLLFPAANNAWTIQSSQLTKSDGSNWSAAEGAALKLVVKAT